MGRRRGSLRFWLERSGPWLGLAGVAVVAVAAAITAVAYTGSDGVPYSPLDHAVSELGEVAFSELASTFNAGLAVGGTLIALSMTSLALLARSRSGEVVGALGAFAGIALVLVGLFPVDDFGSHKVAASAAFGLTTLAAGSLAIWVARGGSGYPSWLALLGLAVVVAMVAFLLLPPILQPEYPFGVGFDADGAPRPAVWVAALLEWLVFILGLAWIAALSWQRAAFRD